MKMNINELLEEIRNGINLDEDLIIREDDRFDLGIIY